MPEGREPRIRGRGHPLPFSKGRMATTLFLAGFEPEQSYAIARAVERAISNLAAEEMTLDELYLVVEEVIGREEGDHMVRRFRAWQRVLNLDRPLVILIGGGTGTGKSSIATEVAYRLGISRITSTDVVRQVMRAFFAPALMPALHYSSFEAGEGTRIPMPDPDEGDRALFGFIQQAEQVAVGAAAVVDRATVEGLSTVVEGVHLVPGLIAPEAQPGATIVQVMLAIEDEEAHQAHVVARDRNAGGARALDRDLKRFGDIRRNQDYLVARAERVGVPVIDASDGDAALRILLDLILERASVQSDAVP
jgi:2-phosphoglycerate kinase